MLAKALIDVEDLLELTLQAELSVKLSHVVVDVLSKEVVAVFEPREVLEDVPSALQEETSYLLDLDVLHEHVFVLELCAVLRVVAHQVLSQEVARIEPFKDLIIDMFDRIGLVSPSHCRFVLHLSLILLGQSLDCWQKNRVQSLCEVDVIVLFLLATDRFNLDGFALHTEEVLDVADSVVLSVELAVIVFSLVKALAGA